MLEALQQDGVEGLCRLKECPLAIAEEDPG
jgi:hypothetical protein